MENTLTTIFQKLDLMHLWPKFEKEKIDAKDIESLSDNELNNLGVTTIGDRIRLRNECRKIVASLPTWQGVSQTKRVIRERNNLFQAYQPQHGPARRNEKRKKKKLWSLNFLCLANPFSNKVFNLLSLS